MASRFHRDITARHRPVHRACPCLRLARSRRHALERSRRAQMPAGRAAHAHVTFRGQPGANRDLARLVSAAELARRRALGGGGGRRWRGGGSAPRLGSGPVHWHGHLRSPMCICCGVTVRA